MGGVLSLHAIYREPILGKRSPWAVSPAARATAQGAILTAAQLAVLGRLLSLQSVPVQLAVLEVCALKERLCAAAQAQAACA